MKTWIKRLANVMAFGAFVLVFILGLRGGNPFDDTPRLVFALVKGAVAAGLFWVIGIVIADIAIKGIVEDIPQDAIDPIDGGMIQHVYTAQKSVAVGEPEAAQTVKASARQNVAAARAQKEQ